MTARHTGTYFCHTLPHTHVAVVVEPTWPHDRRTPLGHTLPSRFASRRWRLAHPSHALASTLRGSRGARHRRRM